MNNTLTSETLVQALERLTHWLLSPAVLRAAPMLPGLGVINWAWPDGNHDGLYPEICGYYLQFLVQAAHLNCTSDTDCRAAAEQIVAFLEAAGPNGDPLTLYHADMANSDWRNACLFVFDLSIIVRGLNLVRARWGLVPDALFDRYLNRTASLVDGDRLASHRLRPRPSAGHPTIPEKWSTMTGVHHVKAAAALLGLHELTTLKPVLEATLAEEAGLLDREGAGRLHELHPFLYLIEGWLTIWGQAGNVLALDRAEDAFLLLLPEIDPVTGHTPPIAGRLDLPVRSDVLAQALRAGVILQGAGRLQETVAPDWPDRRQALLHLLLERQAPDGGMTFDVLNLHRNSWVSLFTWQALLALNQIQAGTFNAKVAASALI